MAKPGDLDFEDRKLRYLNADARITDEGERKRLQLEYADIIKALTPAPEKPGRKAGSSPPEPTSIEQFIIDNGALPVALVALSHLNEVEFEELGVAAAKLHAERNPNASLQDVADAANKVNGAGDGDGLAEETEVECEKAGHYQNPNGEIIKFATGDQLMMTEDGTARVVNPFEGWEALKWQDKVALAKKLGGDVKNKAEAEAYLTKAAAAREAELEAVVIEG